MRIRLVSDVHTENRKDFGVAFIRNLDASDADVLVVAGDLGSSVTFRDALDLIASRVAPKPVIYVHGNHEFYGSDRLSVRAQMANLPANVHWLDHSSVEIEGVTFLGGTGWFDQRKVKPYLEHVFSDFTHIQGLREWVYTEHVAFRQYLRKMARTPQDGHRVLVMHHAPSYAAVLPRWKNSDINDFFCSNMEQEIMALRPSLVLHGHTHSGLRYDIDGIPVRANPVGRPYEFQEIPYDPTFVLEVPSPLS